MPDHAGFHRVRTIGLGAFPGAFAKELPVVVMVVQDVNAATMGGVGGAATDFALPADLVNGAELLGGIENDGVIAAGTGIIQEWWEMLVQGGNGVEVPVGIKKAGGFGDRII